MGLYYNDLITVIGGDGFRVLRFEDEVWAPRSLGGKETGDGKPTTVLRVGKGEKVRTQLLELPSQMTPAKWGRTF